MFSVGDKIIYGENGVCTVESIGPLSMAGAPKDKLYYYLSPLIGSGTYFAPVDSGAYMRPVMSRDEAVALIGAIPTIEPEVFRERTLQLLSQRYQAMLQSGDSRDLLKLTMSVYRKRRQAEEQNRRLGMVDERFCKQAERLLFGELAAALEIPVDQIPAFIARQVEQPAGSANG